MLKLLQKLRICFCLKTACSRAGLVEAKRRGKVGGRPKKLTAKDISAAKAMLADGTLTSKEIAGKLGVSKATLYRHLAG